MAGALLLAAACGEDSNNNNNNNQQMSTACGVAAQTPGAECSGLDECGGARNFLKVNFCENCPRRADDKLCDSGSCRLMDLSGRITVKYFAVPKEANGAKSYVVASFHPIMADGSKLTCAQMMSSSCNLLENKALNVTNAKFANFVMPAADDMVYIAQTLAEPGEDRLLMIRATSDVQGKGTVMAQGCMEGISVPAQGEATIQMMLEAVP